MNKSIKLDVFGKLVLAIHTNDGWEMFYLSEGGKRRLATEIFVPNFVKETELENYIEDICHEWATEKHRNVRRLNQEFYKSVLLLIWILDFAKQQIS